jgi:hypothetical protein
VVGALAWSACADPPDPPPVAHGSASRARWVAWASESEAVRRPVALFVDEPGGPLDLIADQSDVATFLNDRFHPVFRTPSQAGTAPTVRFYSARGCPLSEPFAPRTAEEFIARANEVVLLPASRGQTATHFSLDCPP